MKTTGYLGMLPLLLGRCSPLVLALGLGVGLYFILPDQASWTLDVDENLGGFTTDGAHFFTYPASPKYTGPVRLRDTLTGAQVELFFPDGAELHGPAISDDRRYLAAAALPNKVRVIDFQERHSMSLAAKDVNGECQLYFSPQSDMLRIRADHAKLPDRNFLFDLPSGKPFGNPDDILHVQFAPDGRHLAYWKKDGLHLWDRHAEKEVGHDLGDDERIQFSPDGRRLVTYDDRGDKEPFRLALWDLQTYQRVASLRVEQPLQTRHDYVVFSRDSQWLATWQDSPQDGRALETWDSATGKRLARHELAATRRSLVLAPDSSCLLVNERGRDEDGEPGVISLTLLEMPAAKVRWQRKFAPKEARVQWTGPFSGKPRQNPDTFRFSPDGTVISAFSSLHAEWEYLDVRTGATLKTVHLLDAGATAFYQRILVASPDGRWLLASVRLPGPPSVLDSKWLDWTRRWLPRRHGHHTLIVLYDGTTGDELLREEIEGSAESHLAPDGKTVLTDTSRAEGETPGQRLQAWPVPAQRPWSQIVGIPIVCAAGLLALRWTWRRWRKPALSTG